MKNVQFLIVLTFAIFLFVGCTASQIEQQPASGDTITGTGNEITSIVWKWRSVTGKSSGTSTTVPNPDVYTIIFHEDSTTEGQVDCNTFHGTYSREGGFTITVQPDVMAACDPGSLDQQYLTLLGDIAAGGPDGSGGLALETPGEHSAWRSATAGPHHN